MSTPGIPATVNQSPRELTHSEIARLGREAWVALNIRLTPAKLDVKSFLRVEDYVQKHSPEVFVIVKATVWTNWNDAVRLLADTYFAATKALLYEPNALVWMIEPKALAHRRALELQNKGLEPIAPSDVPDRQKHEDEATAKLQADRANQNAVKSIQIAIDGVVFQNIRGIDQAKIDKVRVELREFVGKNLGKNNGAKILEAVKARIADYHRQHERQQEMWNSR